MVSPLGLRDAAFSGTRYSLCATLTLTAGSRLGPYEIPRRSAPAGWARSTRRATRGWTAPSPSRCCRSTSPRDPELRQRFEREAKPISQLNHPHICTLHDVGHQDGTDYLVMEYLEGETLADRLEKGPLPLDQALKHRHRDRRRARHGAPQRHRPSRSEARQHHADEVGREAARLRPRQARRRRQRRLGRDEPRRGRTRRPAADRAGHDPRHVPVHGARAARGPGGRRAQRHLRVRRGALRDGDGPEGVRGQEPGEPDRARSLEPEPPPISTHPAADAAGARPRRQDLPREGSRRPLADRARRDGCSCSGSPRAARRRECRRRSPRAARAARRSPGGSRRPRRCWRPAALAVGFVRARAERRRGPCGSRLRRRRNITAIDSAANLARRPAPRVHRDGRRTARRASGSGR